jgi:hypothetical protein
VPLRRWDRGIKDKKRRKIRGMRQNKWIKKERTGRARVAYSVEYSIIYM